MKRVLFIVILFSFVNYLWGENNNPEETISFTQREWAEFEAQVQAELEKTALETADEAVKPHRIYEAKLEQEIERLESQKKWWQISTFTIGGIGVLLVLLLILPH